MLKYNLIGQDNMDIYVKSNIEDLSKAFSSLGFEVKDKKSHVSAIHKCKGGRYHALIKEYKGISYCDFHWDNSKHSFFIGVDFKKKPCLFFDEKIKRVLDEQGIEYTIKENNWFTRKNKAILNGITFDVFTWKRVLGLAALALLSRHFI